MDGMELISVDILHDCRAIVDRMRSLAESLRIPLGWHYLLDLSWAATRLRAAPGMLVLDAGAGVGLMQWWLAENGIQVLSVDRNSRADISLRFRSRYDIKGWRDKDLLAPRCLLLQNFRKLGSPKKWGKAAKMLWSRFARSTRPTRIRAGYLGDSSGGHGPTNENRGVIRHRRRAWLPPGGRVYIYNQDLAGMHDIPDASVDAVVSISALEHNAYDHIAGCIKELMRVLKPGGSLMVTMAASLERDWFHQPSKGWCLTESTLRKMFDLGGDCDSNFSEFEKYFEAIRNCDELRENLDPFYYGSGDNGMPWGVWDPKYQPVGIVKTKPGDWRKFQIDK